jgi:ubiquinone/menaquinone biosynthesis C-methylase UbiE
MPTLEWNQQHWGGEYNWPSQGEEWSARWGGADAQWFGTILPRIRSHVPTPSILEIAPGYGRWTHYLKDLCTEIRVVDISEQCIEVCKRRFADVPHLWCYANDGTSLDMIPDRSVDFAFSFDSLVHAEAPVIEAYLGQLARKLKANGVGFIHHSNIGDYPGWRALTRSVPSSVKKLVRAAGVVKHNDSRAFSMTAARFTQFCESAQLQCIGQELINWDGRLLIDCFSLFTPAGSCWARPNQVLKNHHFENEIHYAKKLTRLYGPMALGRQPVLAAD